MGSRLEDLMREVEANPDSMSRVYVPPPNNPIATTPRMRRMSALLLENVLNEMNEHGAEVDLMASMYDREYGDWWRNVEDLVGSEPSRSVGGTILENSRLFDYLGQTPLVRQIMGEDYGQHDDEDYNWMNDPDVLRVLGERMQDTGGLSPMNILLGEYGHDAVVPIDAQDRGVLQGREATEGSVLLPPTTDDWWEDYHPMDSGAFEPLQPEHVGAWIDNLQRVKEITDETARGQMVQGWDW